MSSSTRGVVLLKNGPDYILGRFRHCVNESVSEFFTHQMFKHSFTYIWPEFRKFHVAKLSKTDVKEQPKSLFLESGLQLELMETKRDLTCRQIFRDFLTGPIIQSMQSLSTGDGFYDDLGSSETWVFVDYPHKRIYINGERVYAPDEKPIKDSPMMKKVRGMSNSKSQNSILYLAMDRLKSVPDIVKFYHEYNGWLSKHADLPEVKADPVTEVHRQIGYCFNYFGSSTKSLWRNALDFNHKSITLEFTKFKVVKLPDEL